MSEQDLGLILITGVLVQRSAMSVGGSDEDGVLDDTFCRDGRGRPTLRGTTLAGALLDSIRKCGYPDLPPTVTGDAKVKRNDHFHGESVLRVWTTHPQDCWHRHDEDYVAQYLPRVGVGIRQDTGAAKSGALYDIEILPAGTRWPLVVELDLWRYRQLHQGHGRSKPLTEDGLLSALLAGLGEWQDERCWIGRSVASGLGWMALESVKMRSIPAEKSLQWPQVALYDEQRNERRDFDQLSEKLAAIGSEVSSTSNKLSSANGAWVYLKLGGTIRAGARSDGYGLDSLSIGGHQAGWSEAGGKHLLKPKELKTGAPFPEKPSDMALAMTPSPATASQGQDESWEPFIPGSGIRGALRHALSRGRRKSGEAVRDPLTGSFYVPDKRSESPAPDTYSIGELFGALPAKSPPAADSKSGTQPTHSSRLLIRDAGLSDNSRVDWRYAVLQMHAEDEFTAGVYANSKFDRMAVLYGKFEFQMVVEAPPDEEALAHAAINEIMGQLEGDEGHGLALGGGQWRGHGWVEWCCDSLLETRAGETWPKPTKKCSG